MQTDFDFDVLWTEDRFCRDCETIMPHDIMEAPEGWQIAACAMCGGFDDSFE